MAVGEPAHARAPAAALVVHQADERGMARGEAHQLADAALERPLIWLGLQRSSEHVTERAEHAIDGRAPELLLRIEVVLDEPEVRAGARGDLPRLRALEATLGEHLESRLED